MRKLICAATCAFVFLQVSSAAGQEPSTSVLAHQAAVDIFQLAPFDSMLIAGFTSDYPDIPACEEIQKRSLHAELGVARDLVERVVGDMMAAQFSQNELAMGVRFLEIPAAQEVFEAGLAAEQGDEKSLSPEALQEIRSLGSLPELGAFLEKLAGALDAPRLVQQMKSEFDPPWKRRFDEMANAAGVTCPARDWTD